MLELEIPDGEIIDNTLEVSPMDDPERMIALYSAGKVYGHLGQEIGRYEADYIDIRLSLDGNTEECSFHYISLTQMIVAWFKRNEDGKLCYILLRQGVEWWDICTKLLLLPDDDDMPQWGGDEERFVQLNGRVLLFAGLANINGWFSSDGQPIVD